MQLRNRFSIAGAGVWLSAPLFVLASSAPADAALRVVTTTADLAAIAREIGGDRVQVSAIAAGFQDPHFVDAKPSILLRLQRADLFAQVGMDLEIGWASTLIQNARNPRILPGAAGFVDASQGISRLQIPSAADRSAGDIHAYGNPHYWLDPANGKIIAANLADGLKRVDASGAAAYDTGLAAFDRKLDEALRGWLEMARPLADVPIVAYHNSYVYLEQRFGFRVVGFVEPKPGIPPSGKYVAELAERMKSDGVKVILTSTFYDAKTANLLAKLSGAKVVTLANSVEGLPEAKDYFALFDINLERLLAAVQE
jgi:ABC-type Zn uptake system ZnuABC Zn-binding protein ZnuA